MSVEELAAGLTKAQRAYLTVKAEWKKPRVWAQERWMTFPPAGTHRVLMTLGLVDGAGQIRDTGLAVRSYLMEQDGALPAPPLSQE